MAKSLTAPYLPGERGRHWLKLKPVVTLDLAIVAAEWGYGRRTGWLSNVHLAARDEPTGELLEVGKTFKGLTDAEFKTLTEQLLANKLSEQHNVVWVKPSVVVEVAFSNVQRSPRYAGGVALRLARIVNFRPDKNVDEIDTIQTLRFNRCLCVRLPSARAARRSAALAGIAPLPASRMSAWQRRRPPGRRGFAAPAPPGSAPAD